MATDCRRLVDDPVMWARIDVGFSEMPGLRLTVAQAARLFDLEPAACERLLGLLVGAGRLQRSPDGRYSRRRGE